MSRQSDREIPSSFAEGVAWLRDHADELPQAPPRLHDSTVGDKDQTGAPRFAGEFWRILIGGPYDTRLASETRACSLPHPLESVCQRCDNRLAYEVEREVYVHPLAAALAKLEHAPATSASWPKPYDLVVVLIHAGYDLDRAARFVGHPILGPDHRKTVKAAFLNAIRKLVARWASGPVPRPTYTDLSQAQQNAEAA